MPKWTARNGVDNNSDLFKHMVQEVMQIIRHHAFYWIVTGDLEPAARMIVGNLAHHHGMAPEVIGKCKCQGE